MNIPPPCILVIDDEPAVRGSIHAFLEDHLFDVLEAGDGQQGLALFEEKNPDLIMVDLRMPIMDGFQVLEQVVKRSPDTPVIIVSGTGEIRDSVLALRLGAWDYVFKPIEDMSILLHVINKALEKVALMQQQHNYQRRLEEEVDKRTEELRESNKKLTQEINERVGAEKKVMQYQNQLRALVSQLTLSEERQRKQLAVELHDGICQSLAMTKFKVDEQLSTHADPPVRTLLQDVQQSLTSLIEETRSVTNNLGTPMLQKMGLQAALDKWLDTEITAKHGIRTNVDDKGVPKTLDEDTKALLFRAVRELATNVVKHAQAHTIEVTLEIKANELYLEIEDDGKGFRCPAFEQEDFSQGGYGLFSIHERITYMGGSMTIDSQAHQGTRILLRLPLTGRLDAESSALKL